MKAISRCQKIAWQPNQSINKPPMTDEEPTSPLSAALLVFQSNHFQGGSGASAVGYSPNLTVIISTQKFTL